MAQKTHVFRVKPGQEIITVITDYCHENGITSALVTGIIGSLTSVKLNFLLALPGKYETHEYEGPMEIVGAQGSVALKDGDLLLHIHMQLADRNHSFGGHLVEGRVFSTAEVVLQCLDFQLNRYADSYTGLNELQT